MCKSKKRHWSSSSAAHTALATVQDNAPSTQLYVPTGVIRCGCGGFVLTSAHGKPTARRGRTARVMKGRKR